MTSINGVVVITTAYKFIDEHFLSGDG